ncbi:hypothetical protein MKZ38_004209 [Zalerion maritima]|uniref:Uncharacterized protein n=1 Tax=Zalerion maritima TaxID=339359 RepID=A0AAD5WR82_9PEZI|nr:hypothetical protein MKZ38_004209 [Zalerion maritima]
MLTDQSFPNLGVEHMYDNHFPHGELNTLSFHSAVFSQFDIKSFSIDHISPVICGPNHTSPASLCAKPHPHDDSYYMLVPKWHSILQLSAPEQERDQ